MFSKGKDDPKVTDEPSINESVSATSDEKAKPTQLELFDRACSSGKKIFKKKNAEYGNSIARTGVLGATVTMIGDVDRLRQIVLKSADRGREQKATVINVVNDIHNYANIILIMLADNNWDGE